MFLIYSYSLQQIIAANPHPVTRNIGPSQRRAVGDEGNALAEPPEVRLSTPGSSIRVSSYLIVYLIYLGYRYTYCNTYCNTIR